MKFKSLRSFDLIISNITNNIRKSAEHIPTEPKKAEEWISNVTIMYDKLFGSSIDHIKNCIMLTSLLYKDIDKRDKMRLNNIIPNSHNDYSNTFHETDYLQNVLIAKTTDQITKMGISYGNIDMSSCYNVNICYSSVI